MTNPTRARLPKPKFHREIPVESSWVRSLAYDYHNMILEVQYENQRYRMREVSPTDFAWLMGSDSIGEEVGRMFKVYKVVRVKSLR